MNQLLEELLAEPVVDANLMADVMSEPTPKDRQRGASAREDLGQAENPWVRAARNLRPDG